MCVWGERERERERGSATSRARARASESLSPLAQGGGKRGLSLKKRRQLAAKLMGHKKGNDRQVEAPGSVLYIYA